MTRTKLLTIVVFSLLTAFLCGQDVPLSQRAFIIDSGDSSLLVINVQNGEVLTRHAMKNKPEAIMATPDFSRLLVLHRPNFTKTFLGDYQYPTTQNRISIFEPHPLKFLATLDLGWGTLDKRQVTGKTKYVFGFGDFKLSRDQKRLAFITAGKTVKDSSMASHAAELITVDIVEGKVLGRLELPRTPSKLYLLGDDRTAVIYFSSRPPDLTTVLSFVDLSSMKEVSRLELPGEYQPPILSADNRYFYLFEASLDKKNNNYVFSGNLDIVSTQTHKIENTLDLGLIPSSITFNPDGQVTFVLGNARAAPDQTDAGGRVGVIYGAEQIETIAVAPNPFLLSISPDSRILHCLTRSTLDEIDYQSFSLMSSIPLDMSRKLKVREMVVDAEGQRALIAFQNSKKLCLLDLMKGQKLADLESGRAGVKLFQDILSVALGAITSAYYEGMNQMIATRIGVPGYRFYNNYLNYSFLSSPDIQTSIYCRLDGKYVYAGNSETADITVINAEKGTVVSRTPFPVDPVGFMVLPGEILFCPNQLAFFSTTNNQSIGKIKFKGLYSEDYLNQFCMLPGSPIGLALTGTKVIGIDVTKAEKIWQNKVFVEPIAAIFQKPQEAEETPQEVSTLSESTPLPELLQALKHDYWQTRESAAILLGKKKDLQAMEPLIFALQDKNVAVKEKALRALGEIGDARAQVPITSLLDDKVFYIRRAAAATLEKRGWDKNSLDTRIAILVIGNRWDEIAALGDESIPKLMNIMKKGSPSIAEQCALALAKRGKSALPPLLIALKEAPVIARRSAAKALGMIGDMQALEPLLEALKDQDQEVVTSASSAIASLGQPAVDRLTIALTDVDPRVICQAATILGEIKDPRPIEPLIQCLQSTDSSVRQAAFAGLYGITNKSFGTNYEKWAKWWVENKATFQPIR